MALEIEHSDFTVLNFFEDSSVPVISVTDEEGGVWSYSYDLMNRQTSETDPLGNTNRKTYDADGNLISEIGRDGTDKVELYYSYTVENRLEAVYDKQELLMAAVYDGDGNRVFQLNYNLHTDEDWKGNSGNGNGSNKDNSGSGNSSSNSSSSNSSKGKGNGIHYLQSLMYILMMEHPLHKAEKFMMLNMELLI